MRFARRLALCQLDVVHCPRYALRSTARHQSRSLHTTQIPQSQDVNGSLLSDVSLNDDSIVPEIGLQIDETKDAESSHATEDVAPAPAAEPLLERGPVTRTIRADLIQQNSIAEAKSTEPPYLAHELSRVLFDPGTIFRLQCPRTGQFNFLPTLKAIPDISRFKADLLPAYHPPAEDEELRKIFKDPSRKEKTRYIAATSTCTGVLQQLHYLTSHWRPLNLAVLSRSIETTNSLPTKIHLAPHAILLSNAGSGQYVISSDFKFGPATRELMRVGHMLELKMTIPHDEFCEWLTPETSAGGETDATNKDATRDSNPSTEEGGNSRPSPLPQSHNYTEIGSFLVRSQLDARHPKLSLTGEGGYFDIKTRAVLPVRMDPLSRNQDARHYSLSKRLGQFSSYEREMYDLSRTMLFKYSLQARLGNMDGIFIAYHNLSTVMGFQYLSLADMDEILHGQRDDYMPPQKTLGGQELKMSFMVLEQLFDMIVKRFVQHEVYIHFETMRSSNSEMYVFAEAVDEELQQHIAQTSKEIEARTEMLETAWNAAQKHELHTDVEKAARQLLQDAQALDNMMKKSKAQLGKHEEEPLTVAALAPLVQAYLDVATGYQKLIIQVDSSTKKRRKLLQPSAQRTLQIIKNVENFAADLPEELQHGAFSAVQVLKEGPVKKAQLPKLDWKHRPSSLVAYKITVQNRVNDKTVKRPEALLPTDKWDMQYTITPVDRHDAMKRYISMMSKKLILHDDARVEELYSGPFYNTMTALSATGKKWERDLELRRQAVEARGE